MKYRIRLLPVLFTVLIAGMTGCLKKTEEIQPKIGFMFGSYQDTWNRAASFYIQKEAAMVNNPYALGYASTAEDQAAGITRMLNELGCYALVLQNRGMTPDQINEVIPPGIPLILFEEKPDVAYDFYITGDNEGAGRLAGEHIARTMTAQGVTEGAVLVIDVAGSPRGETRTAACIAALNAAGITNIIRYTADAYTQLAGARVINTLYTDPTPEEPENPEESGEATPETAAEEETGVDYLSIAAVYAQDDAIAAGVLTALYPAATGSATAITAIPNNVKVIAGCGGLKTYLRLILLNQTDISLVSAYYPSMMSRRCFEAAQKLIVSGRMQAEKDVVIATELIDAENANFYLDPALPF